MSNAVSAGSLDVAWSLVLAVVGEGVSGGDGGEGGDDGEFHFSRRLNNYISQGVLALNTSIILNIYK